MKRNVLIIALVCLVAGATAGSMALASSSPGHAGAKKAKLQLRSGKLGRFIVDAKGLTLYLFEKDKNGKSACNGTCAKVWAPYLSSGKPSEAVESCLGAGIENFEIAQGEKALFFVPRQRGAEEGRRHRVSGSSARPGAGLLTAVFGSTVRYRNPGVVVRSHLYST